MREITLVLPDSFDTVMAAHLGIPPDAPYTAWWITDDERRAYIVALLAAIVENLREPAIAAALVRLNGRDNLHELH